MEPDQVNLYLSREIELIHSILEKSDLNMDLFHLIDEVLAELLNRYPFSRVNLGIINENDKLVLHDIFANVYTNAEDQLKNLVQDVFEVEIDYHSSPLWVCKVLNEDQEYYNPDINLENLPDDVKYFFSLSRHKSLYILPIKLAGKIYGFLYLAHNQPLYLDEQEKEYIRRVGALFCKVIDIHRTYQKIKRQNKQLESEIQLAAKIQNEIIPSKYPQHERIQIITSYLPMVTVGGDYFDFITPSLTQQNQFGFIIADVSGHGVPAAFITSMLKICFQSREIKKQMEHPMRVLQTMNETIMNKTASNFITVFYAFFDLNTNIMRYASAGHNPFYLVDKRNGNVEEHNAAGKFIGLFPSLNLEEKEIILTENQRFLFYTDGLTEAINSQETPFEDKLISILQESYQLSSQDLLDLIIQELKQFADFDNKQEFDDDVALVMIDTN